MEKTGIVRDPLFIRHDPGLGHPESPDRLRRIYAHIDELDFADRLENLSLRPATREEICRVHSSDYYERVKATEGQRVSLDPDTSTSADSYRAAKLAAGGAICLVDAVIKGEVQNGYALVRPPGHHAERSRAMGFCLFNNVAIAAQHAKMSLGVERVLIVDWDLHHCNGTMHSFFDRDDILCFSTHQFPYYPGTGSLEEMGSGKGRGFTVNVPLRAGMGDQEYRAVFRHVLAPIAQQFAPELILVSTGFDTYIQDPLGGMRMSSEGYGVLTKELMDLARKLESHLVLILEGGYNLEGLSKGVEFCLRALMNIWSVPDDDGIPTKVRPIIDDVRKIQSGFWKFSNID